MKISNALAVVLILLVGFSAGIATYKWGVRVQFIPPVFAKDEVAQQRFQIQTSNEKQMKICDTKNGNTINIVAENGYEFQIDAKSDCRKDSAK